MEQILNLSSKWIPEKHLLHTRLSGDATQEDIGLWEASLQEALSGLKENSSFKILVDLHGFKAVDVDTHKKYREIIPLTLAHYGWRIGYLDMFEEANNLILHHLRGIHCVGAAHVHQDATKIEKYQSLYGRKNEKYFTDPEKAYQWIAGLPVGD